MVAGWIVAVCEREPPAVAEVVNVNRVNVETGKIEPWKTFGTELSAGVIGAAAPEFSADGSAYAYLYFQDLSVGYVVRGLR